MWTKGAPLTLHWRGGKGLPKRRNKAARSHKSSSSACAFASLGNFACANPEKPALSCMGGAAFNEVTRGRKVRR